MGDKKTSAGETHFHLMKKPEKRGSMTLSPEREKGKVKKGAKEKTSKDVAEAEEGFCGD